MAAMPRYCHIAPAANHQLQRRLRLTESRDLFDVGTYSCEDLTSMSICCGAQWINYATIANYLERELRYMDAGERGSSASLGQ
jgi:hypothetical protein